MTNRKQEMIEYLRKNESSTVEELSSYFDVSSNTIRRDINELAAEGKIIKYYGGVSLDWKQESAYEQRALKNMSEKHMIAERAASFIQDSDHIFIDSGSTSSLILDYIDPNINLTILTNNWNIVSQIKEYTNWNLLIIGNTLDQNTMSFINVPSWDYFDSLNIEKAFLTTTGFSIKAGATNPYSSESIIKTRMTKNSKYRYLLVDSTKFDQISLLTYADAKDFNSIISYGTVNKQYSDFFKENDIEYIDSSEIS